MYYDVNNPKKLTIQIPHSKLLLKVNLSNTFELEVDLKLGLELL